MPTPSEPNKIILKNAIYPNGLTAQTLYDYYIANKDNIIKNCKNRKILFFLSFDPNQSLVVKRNHNGKPIYLNSANYDTFISGHTVSLSKEINNSGKSNLIVIDIDPVNNGVAEDLLKTSVNDLSAYFTTHNDVKSTKVFASAKGYHLYLELSKFYKSNELMGRTAALLKEEFGSKYFVNEKINRRKINPLKVINLDLSPMYFRGSLTVPYSLTRIGTICANIENIGTFKRESTILKGTK